jgi:hypothetical protein
MERVKGVRRDGLDTARGKHHHHSLPSHEHQRSTLTETPDSNGDVIVSGEEKRRVVAGFLGMAGRKAWARERTRTRHSSRSVDAALQERPHAILLVAKVIMCAPVTCMRGVWVFCWELAETGF